MQPSQPHQPSGPGPQPPYRPPEYTVNPDTPYGRPGFGSNSTPVQHPNGQYEVVPPPAQGSGAPSGHNPYEFIMNPNMPKKQPLGHKNAFILRIALIVGGMVALMTVIAVALSLLGPKSSTPGLISIAQRQQEILRISAAATGQATGQDTANFAANINAGVASNKVQIVAYLTSHGTKVDNKLLALDQNPQTDTQLQNASNANNYDTAVTQNLTQQLLTYEGLLQKTFKQTSSAKAKQLLQSSFTSASKLLQQAKTLPANSKS